MKYKVLLHPKANGFLERCDPKLRARLEKKIRFLSEDPQKKGGRINPSDYYKLRVGDYRAIYEIWHAEKKVIILYIGHRSKVYDNFKKLL